MPNDVSEVGLSPITLEVTFDWMKLQEAINILVSSMEPGDTSLNWARGMLHSLNTLTSSRNVSGYDPIANSRVKALEYIPKLAIGYYPEEDLSLEYLSHAWDPYSVEDVMFRLQSSIDLLKHNEPSLDNMSRIARAAFELGIKAKWQTNLNPTLIKDLRSCISRVNTNLSLSICNLAMTFMELGEGEAKGQVDPLSAIWASLLTSGIIYIGELTGIRELTVSEHLCICLQWVLDRSPRLDGIEFIKLSGINTRRHWWFRTPRRILKRKLVVCGDKYKSVFSWLNE